MLRVLCVQQPTSITHTPHLPLPTRALKKKLLQGRKMARKKKMLAPSIFFFFFFLIYFYFLQGAFRESSNLML